MFQGVWVQPEEPDDSVEHWSLFWSNTDAAWRGNSGGNYGHKVL